MEEINALKDAIEKSKKHPKMSNYIIYGIVIIFVAFLIGTGVWFAGNQNQVKLTITNGSEVIKNLEIRIEDTEKARVLERDSVNHLNNIITTTTQNRDSVKSVTIKQKKEIKDLNAKVDSLLRIVNTFEHSNLEPVKRPN